MKKNTKIILAGILTVVAVLSISWFVLSPDQEQRFIDRYTPGKCFVHRNFNTYAKITSINQTEFGETVNYYIASLEDNQVNEGERPNTNEDTYGYARDGFRHVYPISVNCSRYEDAFQKIYDSIRIQKIEERIEALERLQETKKVK